jgi:predicted AAA+ superfamily ATPase
VFEREKTFYALDRAAAVIGSYTSYIVTNGKIIFTEEMERILKEVIVPFLRYCYSNCLEDQRKTTKLRMDRRKVCYK